MYKTPAWYRAEKEDTGPSSASEWRQFPPGSPALQIPIWKEPDGTYTCACDPNLEYIPYLNVQKKDLPAETQHFVFAVEQSYKALLKERRDEIGRLKDKIYNLTVAPELRKLVETHGAHAIKHTLDVVLNEDDEDDDDDY